MFDFGKKIHFVGIGGSGMCALASLLFEKGYEISGSDISYSENIRSLNSLGARVFIGHSSKNVKKDVNLLVYSDAIGPDNPEIKSAKNKKIKTFNRGEFLGLFTSAYKNLIAVSGTHGKTTVSAMLTNVLIDSGKDPTSILGARFHRLRGNSCLGNTELCVCEACEYIDNFLYLGPEIGIILNIDSDHLDYFKTFDNVKKSFKKFAQRCKRKLIVNGDDVNSVSVVEDLKLEKVFFGSKENLGFCATNIVVDQNGCPKFDVLKNGEKYLDLYLNISGEHNALNSLAALAVCDDFGIDRYVTKNSLENFRGADRRFVFVGKKRGVSIFDDFAHHPTEIEAVLKTAKQMNFTKVWVVFQPHTFSRTSMFLDKFAKSLSIADKVILTDILPVRETNIYGIKSEDLCEKIDGAIVIRKFEDVADYIYKNAKLGDMVITMGGGDIYKCNKIIYKTLS
ncbi:MAG: UDP-N-acetylmuramate--L-alanine ligase [Firmicutes bacterium]|nr:UDP-N-acetylmuramate--L-alanine ligase [Bacillota bacterium]